MRGHFLALLCFIGLLFPETARADELRPAYIELNQVSQSEWELLWKASANSLLGHQGEVIIPDVCEPGGKADRRFVDSNILTRQSLDCSGPLAGQSLGLKGLELSTTDALVRISPLGEDTQTLRLTPNAATATISQKDAIANVAWTYTVIGVEHIVFGFDHLLFVLALVLLLKGGWLVAKTVTAFTVAHSITLIGSTLAICPCLRSRWKRLLPCRLFFWRWKLSKRKGAMIRKYCACQSVSRGLSRSCSACFTGSALPEHWPKSGCRKMRFRWHC